MLIRTSANVADGIVGKVVKLVVDALVPQCPVDIISHSSGARFPERARPRQCRVNWATPQKPMLSDLPGSLDRTSSYCLVADVHERQEHFLRALGSPNTECGRCNETIG